MITYTENISNVTVKKKSGLHVFCKERNGLRKYIPFVSVFPRFSFEIVHRLQFSFVLEAIKNKPNEQ